MSIIDVTRFSMLCGLLYDSAINPDAWPIAMEAMRIELGMHNAALTLYALPSGDQLFNCMTNVPEMWVARAADYAADNVALWGPETIAAAPFEEPAVLSRVVGMPDDSWTNPMYVHWAKPQGICDVIAVLMARDAQMFGSLGFGRHVDAPPIGDQVMATTRLLVPHVQRAGAIFRLLDLNALRTATFDALFDELAAPVFLVDSGLRIEHANQAARRLLDEPKGLRSRDGVLSAVDRGVHRALETAVVDATGNFASIGRKGLGVPLRCATATAVLHVLPLHTTRPGRPLAAIFVADVASSPVQASSIVQSLFDLTQAEGAVFDRIAAGNDVPQTAAALGVAQSTVRTHLLRIYDKTGVRRQAELVRLAASLCAPIA